MRNKAGEIIALPEGNLSRKGGDSRKNCKLMEAAQKHDGIESPSSTRRVKTLQAVKLSKTKTLKARTKDCSQVDLRRQAVPQSGGGETKVEEISPVWRRFAGLQGK